MGGAGDLYSWWVGLPSALYVGATIDVGFWPIYIAVRVCEPVSECCTFLLLGGGVQRVLLYMHDCSLESDRQMSTPQERYMH